MEHDSLINKKEDFQIETRFGSFRLRAYQQTTNDRLHIALTKGSWVRMKQCLLELTLHWLIMIF